MKNLLSRVAVLALTSSAFVLQGCTGIGNRTSEGQAPQIKLVNAAAQLLQQCPSWTTISGDDAPARKQILASFEKLSRYDTATLHEAIRAHIEDRLSYDFHDMTKLFLLNRYLFKLPEWVSAEKGVGFGGWTGIPRHDGNINLLWPLHINPSGHFEIVGSSVGYLGEAFLALDEFDYFNKQYGRRP